MRAAMWWIDRWRQSDAFARMTAEEQGLYRNLCDEVVLRSDGVIPDDPRILAKASGDHEAWARSGASVLKSMKKVRGGWTNPTALEVKNESERRSRKQRDYRNRVGNGSGNADGNETGNESDNKPRPPEQEMNMGPETEPEPEIHLKESPGRSVAPTPDGTPVSLSAIEPTATATAPRRLTPQALGIRVDPANFAQVQLSHDLTALVALCAQEASAAKAPKGEFDPKTEARILLHEISATPAGKRIETLDLRRVPTAWATVSSHAAYKLAREVYGVDLATVGAADAPEVARKENPLPALVLTVAPGACPVCSSPLRHTTEGGETVLRCDQETVPCEWAAVWRSCAA